MSAYGFLAPWYDGLTKDVNYSSLADYYETEINRGIHGAKIVLDLACGTGSLTRILAQRNYSMIGVDISEDMLAQAAQKGGDILYLRQNLCTLDLYGTVDAAICSLDGINYISPKDLDEVFGRVSLFLNPGGVFAFDMHSPNHLQGLDGQVFYEEGEDFLCYWRCGWDSAQAACTYDFDLFTRTGNLWRRQEEQHIEYAHPPEEILKRLQAKGFTEISILKSEEAGAPQVGQNRLFITARKGT